MSTITNENKFKACIVCMKDSIQEDYSPCKTILNGHENCPYIPEYIPNDQVKKYLEMGIKKYEKKM